MFYRLDLIDCNILPIIFVYIELFRNCESPSPQVIMGLGKFNWRVPKCIHQLKKVITQKAGRSF